MSILIKNGTLFFPEQNRWQQNDLLIEDGKIAAVDGKIEPDQHPGVEILDARDHLVMPGLINAHAHSYAGVLKGAIDNVPLDIYMLYAIAGGSERSQREIYISAMVDCLQMIKGGITSVIDHFSQRPRQESGGIDAVIRAFDDSGLRAVIAPMFSDKNFFETVPLEPGELPDSLAGGQPHTPQSAESFIAVCEETINKWQQHHNRITITLGTDGPQRCSEKLLQLTADLEQKYRVGWHTHILEAKTQALMSQRLYGKGLVEHLAELGMINERSAFVHSVWLNRKEIAILAEKQATVVHCPLSNLHLGSGVAPVPELLQHRVPVAIGTDGGNLGSLNMFENLRLAALLHRVSTPDYEHWPTAATMLRSLYAGGAKAMLMADELGTLQTGARADVIILKTNTPLWQPLRDKTRQVVFYENGNSVATVMVEGKILLKDGRFTTLNEQDILAEAQEISARLQRDNRAAFDRVQQQIPYFRKMYLREMGRDIGLKRVFDSM